MDLLQKGYAAMFWRILRNRGGYTDKEIAKLHETKWARGVAEISRGFYWFRVEMVKTNRCTVGWKQGDCLYFDSLGMLMKRKCPESICPHAIASISPVIYSCLDRMGRGADPSKFQVEYVSCTDPGFDHKGLGNNLMKISYERMPFPEYLRTTVGLTLTPNLLFRSTTARGPNPGGIE
jgi:uncharacterized repeat protein (TIGR04076 family)